LSVYGVVIDPRAPPRPLGLSHAFPTQAHFLPLPPSSLLPVRQHPPSAALSLDSSSSASADHRPGCRSARDAMPEAAAGSSGKSFLQRARGKVLRWLRRSLRTTHQVKEIIPGPLAKIVHPLNPSWRFRNLLASRARESRVSLGILGTVTVLRNILLWSTAQRSSNLKSVMLTMRSAKGQLRQRPVDFRLRAA